MNKKFSIFNCSRDVQKFNAFIFDLDGTLIDSRRGVQDSIEYAVRKVIPDISIVDFTPFIGPPIKKILTSALGPLEDDLIHKISMEFRVVFDSGGCLKCELYAGVRETLDELASRGIPIYLATNKPVKATHLVLNKLKLKDYFKEIKAPNPHIGQTISKKEMLHEIIASEFLDFRNTLMVGDTKEDWEAARFSSIQFAACLYGYGLKASDVNKSCLRLTKMKDLYHYIQNYD